MPLPLGEAGAQRAPCAEIRRKLQCDHWQGEEGYDADRRAQISAAVRDLRCEAEPADGAALKVKYADNPMLTALIARTAGSSDP